MRVPQTDSATLTWIQDVAAKAENVKVNEIPKFLKDNFLMRFFTSDATTIKAVAEKLKEAKYSAGSEMSYVAKTFEILDQKKG